MKKLKTLKEHILFEGKFKPDATQFEGDLIGAMLHIRSGGRNSFKKQPISGSSNIKWDPDKKVMDPKDKDNYDATIHNTYKLAAGIAEKMDDDNVDISKPGRVSGDSSITISKLYSDMGVTKKESKTDITYGGMYVSVKAHSAQILSSQANETAAIIQSVVKYDIPEKAKALAKTSADILREAFSKDMFDKIVGTRDHIQLWAWLKEYGIDKVMADHKKKTRKTMPYSQAKKLLWDAAGSKAAKMKKRLKDMHDINVANQKLMTSFMGFDPKKPSKEQEKLFQGMSDALNVTSEVQQEVANFLKNPKVRQAIIAEAATGKHKFDTKDAIATHVLAWNDDPDNPKYHHADIQDFVKQAEPSLRISITTRGTGSSKCLSKALDDNDGDLELALRHCTRGGSMRATINTLFDSADLTHYELEPLEQDDYQYLEEQWKEVEEVGTRVLLENWEKTQHLLLQEGIIDSVKKGYEVVKAGAKKIMAKLKGFFMAIGEYLMKWIRNTGAYIKAFGMKPKVTGPKWKPNLQ